jgi:hypothetical protein
VNIKERVLMDKIKIEKPWTANDDFLQPLLMEICDEIDGDRLEYIRKYNRKVDNFIWASDVFYSRMTERKSLAQIGREYGVSGSRVRQIESMVWRAITKYGQGDMKKSEEMVAQLTYQRQLANDCHGRAVRYSFPSVTRQSVSD